MDGVESCQFTPAIRLACSIVYRKLRRHDEAHFAHFADSDALQLIVSISTLLVSSLPDEKEEKCC